METSETIQDQKRMILISLQPGNIEEYEKQDAISVLHKIEALDEAYYSIFPSFSELAAIYGNPGSTKLYRIRDLYSHYRTKYMHDHKIHIYDVTDERQSGSRRY